MEYLFVGLLTLFLVFFPSDEAVAMTALVHFPGNLFKLVLVGRAC